MLFADEDPATTRDCVVEPAKPSQATRKKVCSRKGSDGMRVLSFHALMKHMATLTKDETGTKEGGQQAALCADGGAISAAEKAFKLLGVRCK